MDRLKKNFNLYSMNRRCLRADLIKCLEVLHGRCPCPIETLQVLEVNLDTRTRGYRFRIKVSKCEVYVKAWLFSNQIINGWNSLPGWVVEAITPGEFKSRLSTVLERDCSTYYSK